MTSRVNRVGASLGKIRTFSSLKNPGYRIYMGSMFGFWASMGMQMVAFSLLVYRISNSAAVLGIMFLANGLPALFMSFAGGALADRIQKKHIVLFCLVAQGVVTIFIAITLNLGFLSVLRPGSWWVLVVTAAAQGALQGLMMPSLQAMIPEIVESEQVMNAVALSNLGSNAVRLAAPAIAGFIIEGFGFTAAYYVITGLIFLSAALVGFIPVARRVMVRSHGTLGDLIRGLQYLRGERSLLLVLAFTLVGVLLSQPFMALIPIFTDTILKVGARGLGLLMAFSGVGAIAGSLVVASLPARKRGLMLMISSLILGLALMGFAFSSSWGFVLFMMVLVGLGQALRMTLGNALLQSYSSAEFRGRVMGFLMMQQSFSILAGFFSGLLAAAIGAPWVVGGMAIGLASLSVLALLFEPRMRRLD